MAAEHIDLAARILFAVAGLVAVATIADSVRAALPKIADLRRQPNDRLQVIWRSTED